MLNTMILMDVFFLPSFFVDTKQAKEERTRGLVIYSTAKICIHNTKFSFAIKILTFSYSDIISILTGQIMYTNRQDFTDKM